jgi:hypothetical protein
MPLRITFSVAAGAVGNMATINENGDLQFEAQMQIPAGFGRQGSAEKLTDGEW